MEILRSEKPKDSPDNKKPSFIDYNEGLYNSCN